MKHNFSKIIITALLLVIISACYKTSSGLGSAGPNLVRFPLYSPSAVNTNPVVLLTGTQACSIQINRDVSDGSILNQAETVTLSIDNSIITSHNTANSTSFFAIDPSVYTFDAKNPLVNGKITVSFAAGEFIKYIFFSLDLTKVPAGASAFGIKIEQSTICKTSTGSNSALVAFIKNPFAGTYNVSGTRYNYTGTVAWNNVLPVPAGYTGTTDMSLSSPRTAVPVDGSVFTTPLGNIGAGYNYQITYNATTKTITVNYLTGANLLSTIYSNIVTTVVSVTVPSGSTKGGFHIITHYNNALAGGGNDRIFDETFVQQ